MITIDSVPTYAWWLTIAGECNHIEDKELTCRARWHKHKLNVGVCGLEPLQELLATVHWVHVNLDANALVAKRDAILRAFCLMIRENNALYPHFHALNSLPMALQACNKL